MLPLVLKNSFLKLPSGCVVVAVLYFCLVMLRYRMGYSLRNSLQECAILGTFTFFFAMSMSAVLDRNGLSSYGAMLGGFIGICFLTVDKKQMSSVLKTFDEFATLAALAYCIFRWTCFLYGCCWGIDSPNLPWGVVYPASGNHPTFHVSHPVQLYDSYLHFLLFLLLIEKQKKERFEGESILLFLLGHSLIRFFVDYYRWGVSTAVVGGIITQTQIASVLIFICSLIAWVKLSRNTVGPEVRVVASQT